MKAYPSIADHGLIGDLQTSALVATDGSVDWFCSPRIDSPSIFGSLLDQERGGHFRISPHRSRYTTKQLYFPDTAILITRFLTEHGVGEVMDFMPIATGRAPTDNHRLVRLLRCVRGKLTFDVDIAPRFDYGRQPHEARVTEGGFEFQSKDMRLAVHPVREPADQILATTEIVDGDVHAQVNLEAGMVRGLVLETSPAGPPHPIPVAEIERLLDDTAAFWRAWLSRCQYTGRWREMVARSAITLKLMTYAPSGALVAAPTAGLPEQVGGERNWDYRYTWIRDASFSVYALLGLGFTEEAAAFTGWLGERVKEAAATGGRPLKIMYRVDGSTDLTEEILKDWEGYRGSSPVRIGNGAVEQLQLDIYGEALDCLHFADQRGIELDYESWTALTGILDWVAENWDQPEEGIWETRGGRQDFTYGRFMCWVALDRGVRLAAERGRPANFRRWTDERDTIYRQIMSRGWNTDRSAFIQHYGSDVLDSSLLRMPTAGFIAARDPRWLSTLTAMDDELVSDSLVYRYNPSASPDGLRGSEGTFSLCTFWYVDALARAGRLDDARLVFEKMLTYANHLGLYSEEIGLTGDQIGNFPQAFTHLALINAALSLNALLDAQPPAAATGQSLAPSDA